MSKTALTANALAVLQKRYLLKDEKGEITETPDELFVRVAKAIAEVEKPSVRKKWQKLFLELMTSKRFMPNSPTLMNAGKKNGQLSACFVLPIEDSLDKIFDTLKSAALIQQSGGGTGFGFSDLRPKGSVVSSTAGTAAGPVSFMKVFDAATEAVKQGGTRRGANMAVLRVDHPDVLDFIRSKTDGTSITNFNISLGVTDEFMRALSTGGKYWLRDPRNQNVLQQVSAMDIFQVVVDSAWICGDPGVVFLDRINQFNPTPKLGPMKSTNPCGEQPLLAYESCNLGSINLGLYVLESKNQKTGFDWKKFRSDVHIAVRFLDNVIDANCYPLKETRAITLRNRKIGLGVMGFADLLLTLGIPYGEARSFQLAEKIMAVLDHEAKSASAKLAKKRGAFANFKGSLWENLGYPQLRNATVTTVAPTGTISMIAGASSGIEPIFSGIFYRNVLDGARLLDIHPAVLSLLKKRGLKDDEMTKITEAELTKLLGLAWTPTSDVSVDSHVRMQAMFQRHSDSAVSKTINLPKAATREDIGNAYRLAYELGCKGITVYRDQSRSAQVLERPKIVEETDPSREPGAACPTC